MDVRLVFAAASAVACFALPNAASAQGYGEPYADARCEQMRNNRTLGGAVAGAVVGGVFGNQVAGRGARDEGTALGAVVGGVVGSQLGRTSVACGPVGGPPPQAGPGYGEPAFGGPGYAAGGAHPDFYRSDNLVAGGAGNSNGYGVAESHLGYAGSGYSEAGYGEELYGGAGYGGPNANDYGYGGPNANDYGYGGPNANECRTAQQVTRMPDGREVWREELVCLDPYTGEWVQQN